MPRIYILFPVSPFFSCISSDDDEVIDNVLCRNACRVEEPLPVV